MAGDGTFDPASVERELTGNPVSAGSVYKQPGEPGADDMPVIGEASAGGKSDEDTLILRGVALEAIKSGPECLYSGTATGKACCDITIRAYCPSNTNLKPQGKIHANIAGSQDGVYLKWWDEGAAKYKWAKSREVDLKEGYLPGMPPQGPYQLAAFTVATDNPGDLPNQPIDAAVVTFHLNGASSPVSTYTTVKVLVPLKLRIAWEGEECSVRRNEEFNGALKWYADDGEAKFYWGAKGGLEWQLPEGTHESRFQNQVGSHLLSEKGDRAFFARRSAVLNWACLVEKGSVPFFAPAAQTPDGWF